MTGNGVGAPVDDRPEAVPGPSIVIRFGGASGLAPDVVLDRVGLAHLAVAAFELDALARDHRTAGMVARATDGTGLALPAGIDLARLLGGRRGEG